jgi:glyoxylase-like metal-dependent hydrolase (beta-lactamase superfamily II)
MKIHAVQTGTVRIKTRQRSGQGVGLMRIVNTLRDPEWTPPLPIYAWVIEHPEGVIVVDVGETSRAMQRGYYPRWHPYYGLGVRMQVHPEDEIGSKLQALGIPPQEVRWVVLTHLHCDHSGGLHHFPKAEILVARKEFQATQGIGGRIAGYLPHRWPDGFMPRLVDFIPEPVGAFSESFRLTKAGDVVLVPMFGHSPGHLSVMLNANGLSYFFAGDTS